MGALFDDDAGDNSFSGSAYVFGRSGTTWSEEAKLTAPDAAAGDGFGFRVAIDGATGLVGANLDDDAGSDSGSAYVFVLPDTTPPVVTVSPDIIDEEATGPSGAAVTYTPATATDDVGVTVGPTCAPASGSNFSIGTTTVTCTASDAAGNVGSASFTVTVVDTTHPVVTVSADITGAIATSPSGATVTYPPATATDNVGVTSGPTCTPVSGSTFPVGITTVTCTASDAAANVGSAFFKVTVITPTEAIQRVADTVLLLGLPNCAENSFVSKLESAVSAFERGQENTAINQLNAFINEVEALRGGTISGSDADALIAEAERIIAAVESSP